MVGQYQIDSDGITVWVNHPEGWCAARFGCNGIDIHRAPDDAEINGQCLQCTHTPVTPEDWEAFKAGVLRHYGVIVTDAHKPKRFL